MAISKADVIAIAPELSTVPDATWDLVLAMTEEALDADAWGDYLDTASLYYAAHKAALTRMGAATAGTAGPITSKKAGPVSVTYGVPQSGSAVSSLSLTVYGQEYLRLVRRHISTMAVL